MEVYSSCKKAIETCVQNQSFAVAYQNDYPAIRILLRGDNGFATPDLYKQCEENGKAM